MNDNNLNYNNSDNNNVYRVTTNFNTALESLNSDNINSATSVNILGPEYSNGVINNSSFGNGGLSMQSTVSSDNNTYQGQAPEIISNNTYQQSVTLVDSNIGQINNNFVASNSNFSSNNISVESNIFSNTIDNSQVGGVENFSDSSTNQFITVPYNNANNANSSFGLNGGIDSSRIANTSFDVYMGNDAVTTTKKVAYEPAVNNKKKPSVDNTGSIKDSLFIIVITFILIGFVFAFPYIYDFLREAWSAFING